MSKFSCFVFGNPTNKTGTVGTTNSKPWTNHYDRPIRNTKPQSLYYTFVLEVHNCVAHFTSHSMLHEFGAEKPISSAKPAHLTFSK
jgi:hypothetical protein